MTVNQEYRRNLIVGVFVLGGLVALGVMIVLFGQVPQSFTATYEITMYFPSAGPVRAEDPVLLNGMEIGRVLGIEPQPDVREGIKLTAAINSRYRIPIDAVVEIRKQTLSLGQAAVRIEVTPESSDQMLPIDGKGTLHGMVLGGIEELIPRQTMQDLQEAGKSLTKLAQSLRPVAEDLHELLRPRSTEEVDTATQPGRPLANISTVAQRLDEALKNFNAVMGDPENRKNLQVALSNLRIVSQRGVELAESFKGLLGRADNLTDTAQEQIERIGRKITGVCDRLSTVLDNLVVTTDQLARGDGSAGRFLRDPELYESLSLTFRRLQLAIDELRDLLGQWREKGLKIEGGLLGK